MSLRETEEEQDTDRYNDGAEGPRSVGEVLERSNYKGSIITRDMVALQISERFGTDAAKEYDPYSNCFSYKEWKKRGYEVLHGQKALRSITYVEKTDESGRVIRKYPRSLALFFISQVKKI